MKQRAENDEVIAMSVGRPIYRRPEAFGGRPLFFLGYEHTIFVTDVKMHCIFSFQVFGVRYDVMTKSGLVLGADDENSSEEDSHQH
ncbi:hypothetical protein ACHAXS_013742 [Conticribra weissflogii]